MTIAGGAIIQILMPLAFVLYFYFTNHKFSGALTTFWLGQNFLGVSVYVGNAVRRALPLLGGDSSGHDWYNMLKFLGLLAQTDFIAVLIRGVGVIIILAAIIFGFINSFKRRAAL